MQDQRILVVLGQERAAACCEIGKARYQRATKHRFSRRWGQIAEATEGDHMIGAVGEGAFAYWWREAEGFESWLDRSRRELEGGAAFDKIADLEGAIEVRSTRWRLGLEGGPVSLILHPEDDPESVYVLCVSVTPGGRAEIAGWLPGHLAKHRFWFTDPFGKGRACYAVPETKLFDPERIGAIAKLDDVADRIFCESGIQDRFELTLQAAKTLNLVRPADDDRQDERSKAGAGARARGAI